MVSLALGNVAAAKKNYYYYYYFLVHLQDRSLPNVLWLIDSNYIIGWGTLLGLVVGGGRSQLS